MKRRHFLLSPLLAGLAQSQTKRQVSGVYPHLAMFNTQGECGTGAVVGLPARLLGGWQASVTAVAYTGFPVTPTANSTVLNAPGSSDFADCVGPVQKLGLRTQWWDRAGLADPNAVDPRTPRFGSCGSGVLRGPGVINTDLGVHRKLRIAERFELSVRGEAFNVSNTPHFASPNSNISSGNFGLINDVANTGRHGIDQRIFRLGIRLGW